MASLGNARPSVVHHGSLIRLVRNGVLFCGKGEKNAVWKYQIDGFLPAPRTWPKHPSPIANLHLTDAGGVYGGPRPQPYIQQTVTQEVLASVSRSHLWGSSPGRSGERQDPSQLDYGRRNDTIVEESRNDEHYSDQRGRIRDHTPPKHMPCLMS